MYIRRDDAVEVAGGNQSELARMLGTVRQTVHAWPEWIPELWVYRLRDRCPDLVKKLHKNGKIHWEKPAAKRLRRVK